MARLEPKNDDIAPKTNVPTIAPKLDMEDIHDSCSFVIGPVMRGVLSENSIGIAGDNHPTIQP